MADAGRPAPPPRRRRGRRPARPRRQRVRRPAAGLARRRAPRVAGRDRRLPVQRPSREPPSPHHHGRPEDRSWSPPARPRRSRSSPGCVRGGGRSWCTRSSPSRTRRSSRPATRSPRSSSAAPFLLDPARSPRTPTWSSSATRPTRPASCTRPPRSGRCSGPAGWSSSTRRSWTACPARPSRWPATGTATGCVVIRSSPSTGASPASAPATCSAHADVVADLRRAQVPWSVSTTALRPPWSPAPRPRLATRPAAARRQIADWRKTLESGLDRARHPLPAVGARRSCWHRPAPASTTACGSAGIAVRRADTFPGLDDSWVRIAVRPPDTSARLLQALAAMP